MTYLDKHHIVVIAILPLSDFNWFFCLSQQGPPGSPGERGSRGHKGRPVCHTHKETKQTPLTKAELNAKITLFNIYLGFLEDIWHHTTTIVVFDGLQYTLTRE